MEKLMEVSMKMRLVRMTVDIPLGLHNKIAKYNTAKWILFSQREEWSISHWPLINVREHFSQIFFHHSLLMAFFSADGFQLRDVDTTNHLHRPVRLS